MDLQLAEVEPHDLKPSYDASAEVPVTCRRKKRASARPRQPTNVTPRSLPPLPVWEVGDREGLYNQALACVRRRRPGTEAVSVRAPCDAAGWAEVRPKYLRLACLASHPGSEVPLRRVSKLPRLPPRQAPPDDAAPVLHIVEAPASLLVQTAGGDSFRLRSHTWLVLGANADVSNEAPGEGHRLADEAGGGCIAASDGSPLLQVVSGLRQTATGAEANFQRAARGTSMVAFKHAAFILRRLADRTVSSIDVVPSDEELNEKIQRVEKVVAARVADLSRRRDPSPPSSAFRRTAISVELAASSNPVKMSAMLKGLHAMTEFMAFATRRFGNSVRLWFMLDPEENMKIGEQAFARTVTDIGFQGNVSALWRYLDRDGSGQISLSEVDPRAAVILADFKKLIVEKMFGSIERTLALLDRNKSNRIFRAEFAKAMKTLGYTGPIPKLFDLLARQPTGFIAHEDFNFLAKWHPPPYLFSEPDPEGWGSLKEVLLDMSDDNELKAWRTMLDQSQSMKVTWEDFRAACALAYKHSSSTVPDLPHTEEEIAGAWRALDEDCSGWVALREFDVETYNMTSRLKRWADENCGSITQMFREIGGLHPKVTKTQIRKFLRERGAADVVTKDDVDTIFEGLDLDDDGVLVELDSKYLDRWDLVWEDREYLGVVSKRHAR